MLKPARGMIANMTHPINRGLQGCWLLNDRTGTSVADASGHRRHGTFTNMSEAEWIPGAEGGALDFDNGTTEYVNIPNPLTAYQPVTLYVRALATNTTNVTRFYFGRQDDHNHNIQVGVGSNSSAYYFVSAGGVSTLIESSASISANVWYSVAGVSAAANDHKLYLDGIQDGSSTAARNVSTSTPIAAIGAQSSTTFFDGFGSIAEARIWDRALSADEIRYLSYLSYEEFSNRPVM